MGRILSAAGLALAAMFSLTSTTTVAAEPLLALNAAPTFPTAEVVPGVVADIAPAPPSAPLPAAPPAEAPPAPTAPAPKRSLAELVAAHGASEPGSRELECLATTVYFEAKGEGLPGQLAVAEVVRNRAKSGRFPPSYCGVLFQRGQFSFVRGGRLPAAPRASLHWRRAVAIAKIADGKLADAVAPRALFFHATRVSPGWRLTRLATIGNHVFYR